MAVYALFYFPCFVYLEKHITDDYHIIYTALDDQIPFIEYFILPYLLWFPFVAAGILLLFFTDVKEYYRLAAFLIAGMTIFLIISALYPNGQPLRPTAFVRDNFCTTLVQRLYETDTPTNVFPSLHVYNSIGIAIGIWRSKKLADKLWIRTSALTLAILIILSTVFLKQHSVIDVIGAFLLAIPIYFLTYKLQMRRG